MGDARMEGSGTLLTEGTGVWGHPCRGVGETSIWRWQQVGNPYGGIRDTPDEGNVCSGRGLGTSMQRRLKATPNRWDRGTPRIEGKEAIG